jgi:hypothetical protein
MVKATARRLALIGEVEAQAAAAFLAALGRLLPTLAYAALTGPEVVQLWAEKLGIDCPPVREAATSLARLRVSWQARYGTVPAALEGLLRFSPSYVGPEYPAVWREDLARLNGLPVWTGPFTDVLNLFEERVPAPSPKLDPKAEQELRREWKTAADAQAAVDEVNRQLQHLHEAAEQKAIRVRNKPRVRALRDPRVLAPLAWDPLTESVSDLTTRFFLWVRARQRQCNKVLRKARVPTHPAVPRPELQTHADWLARHLVRGETWEQIAQAIKGRTVEPSAIKMACRRLAEQLGLRLPPGPRGRPRKNQTST